jgi:hypothetical protein
LRGAHARELEGAHIKIDELQKQLQAGETKTQADHHKMFHLVEQQRMRDFEEHAKTTRHLEERLREAQGREREILNHLMTSEENVTEYKGESESLRNTVEELKNKCSLLEKENELLVIHVTQLETNKLKTLTTLTQMKEQYATLVQSREEDLCRLQIYQDDAARAQQEEDRYKILVEKVNRKQELLEIQANEWKLHRAEELSKLQEYERELRKREFKLILANATNPEELATTCGPLSDTGGIDEEQSQLSDERSPTPDQLRATLPPTNYYQSLPIQHGTNIGSGLPNIGSSDPIASQEKSANFRDFSVPLFSRPEEVSEPPFNYPSTTYPFFDTMQYNQPSNIKSISRPLAPASQRTPIHQPTAFSFDTSQPPPLISEMTRQQIHQIINE